MIWAPIANFEKALNMYWEQIKEIWHSFCPPAQAQTIILNFLTWMALFGIVCLQPQRQHVSSGLPLWVSPGARTRVMHFCYHFNLTKFCPRRRPDSSVLASLLNNPLRKCRLSIMTKSVWGCDKEKTAAYIKHAFKQCHSKLGSSEVPPRLRVEHFRSNLNACCWRSCEHLVYLRRHKICLDWYGVHGKLKCKHIPRFVNDRTTQRSLFVQKFNFIEVNFQVWYKVVPYF